MSPPAVTMAPMIIAAIHGRYSRALVRTVSISWFFISDADSVIACFGMWPSTMMIGRTRSVATAQVRSARSRAMVPNTPNRLSCSATRPTTVVTTAQAHS